MSLRIINAIMLTLVMCSVSSPYVVAAETIVSGVEGVLDNEVTDGTKVYDSNEDGDKYLFKVDSSKAYKFESESSSVIVNDDKIDLDENDTYIFGKESVDIQTVDDQEV